MTSWIPDLQKYSGPMYLAFADALQVAIHSGQLKSGDVLPSQRMLADFTGLHVNTVNRAIRETTLRGLTSGRTRRGTTILQR